MPIDRNTEAGFSLVTVLWILVAISAVLAPIAIKARTQALHTASVLQIDRLDLLSRGLANVLAVRHMNDRQTIANSTETTCAAGGLVVRFTLQSHAGLVSLNHAPKPALTQAVAAMGQDNAANLAEAIIANRSYRQGGGSQPTSVIRGGAKQAPFESVSELYEIEGLLAVPYPLLHSTFTAHSTSNTLSAPDLPAHLKRAAEASRDLQTGSTSRADVLTVSVDIRRGTVRGQFNGIFAGGPGRVVESWRHSEFSDRDVSEGEPCASYFGTAVADSLEEFI